MFFFFLVDYLKDNKGHMFNQFISACEKVENGKFVTFIWRI